MQIDKFIDPTFKTSIVFYVTWITIHHISTHLYAYFCVGNDIYSILLSPFITVTPFCQGLNWAIYNGSIQISSMWLSLGTWLSILILFKK
jgi:hypothetical protein